MYQHTSFQMVLYHYALVWKFQVRKKQNMHPLPFNPFKRAFEYIPTAYKKIMEYFNANGCRQNLSDEYVCCFEYVYQKDDMTYMTVCVAVDALARANLITPIR